MNTMTNANRFALRAALRSNFGASSIRFDENAGTVSFYCADDRTDNIARIVDVECLSRGAAGCAVVSTPAS
jgi:hypothetical protein